MFLDLLILLFLLRMNLRDTRDFVRKERDKERDKERLHEILAVRDKAIQDLRLYFQIHLLTISIHIYWNNQSIFLIVKYSIAISI